MNNLKHLWEQLSHREQRIVFYGAIIVAFLMVYLIIWAPIADAVNDKKNTVHSQQQLLRYLQGAAFRVEALKSQGISINAINEVNILTLVEKSLAQQQLQTYLKQVQQPQSHQIDLTFKAVPFDKLSQWLQKLVMQNDITVESFSAKRTDVGAADVEMSLGGK